MCPGGLGLLHAVPEVREPGPERVVSLPRRVPAGRSPHLPERSPMTLTAFLLARIAEDESAAQRAMTAGGSAAHGRAPGRTVDAGAGAEITDPARVLVECRVKRQVVVLADEATGLDQTVDMEREADSRHDSGIHYVGDRILRAMASVYAGHPDYDPAWRG